MAEKVPLGYGLKEKRFGAEGGRMGSQSLRLQEKGSLGPSSDYWGWGGACRIVEPWLRIEGGREAANPVIQYGPLKTPFLSLPSPSNWLRVLRVDCVLSLSCSALPTLKLNEQLVSLLLWT